MRLTELLDIDVNSKKIISVVGGGGKTSLIFRLAEELAEQGKKVIVTTTTHIAFEPERPFARDGELNKVRENLRKYGYTVAACMGKREKKVGKSRKIFRDPQVRTAALPKSRTKAENCLQESFRRFRRSSFRN